MEKLNDSIERLSTICQIVQTLPSTFMADFVEMMGQKVVDVLEDVEEFMKDSLTETICVEDFSKNQFQDLLKCMVCPFNFNEGAPFNFNEKSSNEEPSKNEESRNEEPRDKYYHSIRLSLTGEDYNGNSVLACLSRFGDGCPNYVAKPGYEYRRLDMLQHFRKLKLFHKKDITELELLRKSFHANNQSIFHFCMEWDSTALKSLSSDETKITLLQELLYENYQHDDYPNYERDNYPPAKIKFVLKAGLKYFPSELGLLFFTIEGNESPYALLMEENRGIYDREAGWTIIEESLEEMKDLKLHEPDPTTNMYPFMVAACDQSCQYVDLVYYLLRKDPSAMAHFNRSYKNERGLEKCTRKCNSRKRKMIQ
jgi:hypothetical protein